MREAQVSCVTAAGREAQRVYQAEGVTQTGQWHGLHTRVGELEEGRRSTSSMLKKHLGSIHHRLDRVEAQGGISAAGGGKVANRSLLEVRRADGAP